jgi:hypothetical protein
LFTGIIAVLLDLGGLAILGIINISAFCEWKSKRRYRYIALIIILAFVDMSLLWREGGRLSALVWMRTLDADRVVAVRVGPSNIEEPDQIEALVGSLRGSTWISPEHSCQGSPLAMVIDLVDGRRKTFWIAANPCAEGTVLNLSKIGGGGFYRGAVFSESLGRVLEKEGIAVLPPPWHTNVQQ